jgi:hypothetical protein
MFQLCRTAAVAMARAMAVVMLFMVVSDYPTMGIETIT